MGGVSGVGATTGGAATGLEVAASATVAADNPEGRSRALQDAVASVIGSAMIYCSSHSANFVMLLHSIRIPPPQHVL